jgi:hypothetical protein
MLYIIFSPWGIDSILRWRFQRFGSNLLPPLILRQRNYNPRADSRSNPNGGCFTLNWKRRSRCRVKLLYLLLDKNDHFVLQLLLNADNNGKYARITLHLKVSQTENIGIPNTCQYFKYLRLRKTGGAAPMPAVAAAFHASQITFLGSYSYFSQILSRKPLKMTILRISTNETLRHGKRNQL